MSMSRSLVSLSLRDPIWRLTLSMLQGFGRYRDTVSSGPEHGTCWSGERFGVSSSVFFAPFRLSTILHVMLARRARYWSRLASGSRYNGKKSFRAICTGFISPSQQPCLLVLIYTSFALCTSCKPTKANDEVAMVAFSVGFLNGRSYVAANSQT